MTKNQPKITQNQLFSGFFGFPPQFIGIWSKVTKVWVRVAGPRADFASLLLTFGARPRLPAAWGLWDGVWGRKKSKNRKNFKKSKKKFFFSKVSTYDPYTKSGKNGLAVNAKKKFTPWDVKEMTLLP